MYDEKDEKYNGFCLRCVDYPPYFRDFSDKPISLELLYNPWCTLCYKKRGKEPTAFWEKGDPDRFYHYCDPKKLTSPIKRKKKVCGWEPPKDIQTSPEFDKVLIEHLVTVHGMNRQHAMIETSHIMRKQVINKYLVPNPEEQ